MTVQSPQQPEQPKKLRIGRLKTLSQLGAANGRVTRAVARGDYDPAQGARISYMLSVQRQILEAQALERQAESLERLERQLAARDAIDVTPSHTLEWKPSNGYQSSDSGERQAH
jgi:hypothetical protein